MKTGMARLRRRSPSRTLAVLQSHTGDWLPAGSPPVAPER
jgi:hypothetical protein